MSDSEAAPAASDAPAHLAPQKKVSGLLVVSIVLTLAGIFVVPLIATVGGLICAVKGRMKAMKDPLVIGPRFGMFCIIAAVLAFPVNGWQIYGIYDNLTFQQESSVAIESVFSALRERNYEKAYNALDPSYRTERTLEQFTAEMTAAFPGSANLVLAKETIAVRADEFTQEEQDQWKAFFQDKTTSTLDHTSRIVATEGEIPTNIDLRLLIRRNGYAEYSVIVQSLRAWPAEAAPPGLETPEKPSPEEAPEKGTLTENDEPK